MSNQSNQIPNLNNPQQPQIKHSSQSLTQNKSNLTLTLTHQQQNNINLTNKNIDIFEYQYEHIADRLLRELQQDYLQVHKYQINQSNINALRMNMINVNTNLNNLKNQQNQDDDNDDIPQGYQNLDNDNDNLSDNNINSSEQSSQQQKQHQQQKQQQNKQQQTNQIYININTQIQQIHEYQLTKQKQQINPQNLQLIQVGPVPESVFIVPQPTQNNLDYDKIKCFALSFDIQTPDWAKDPLQLENKIRKLFGKNNMMNNNSNNNNGNSNDNDNVDNKNESSKINQQL